MQNILYSHLYYEYTTVYNERNVVVERAPAEESAHSKATADDVDLAEERRTAEEKAHVKGRATAEEMSAAEVKASADESAYAEEKVTTAESIPPAEKRASPEETTTGKGKAPAEVSTPPEESATTEKKAHAEERAVAERRTPPEETAPTDGNASAVKRVSTEERACEKESASAELLHQPCVMTILVALSCYTGLVMLFGYAFVLGCLLTCIVLLPQLCTVHNARPQLAKQSWHCCSLHDCCYGLLCNSRNDNDLSRLIYIYYHQKNYNLLINYIDGSVILNTSCVKRTCGFTYQTKIQGTHS